MLKRLFCAIALAFVLSACTWHPLTIEFNADSSLNKNKLEQSTPVAVKLVQLNQSEEFSNEDINTIWQQHLSNNVREVYIDPSTKKTIHWQRLSGMQYLAVIAHFRLCDTGYCKLIVPLGRRVPIIAKVLKFKLVDNTIKEIKK